MRRTALLVSALALLLLAGCSRVSTKTQRAPLVEYQGSYGRLLVCGNLETAFTCTGSYCNNGQTVYRLTMAESVWKEFETALRTDRTNAPIASVLESNASQASLEQSSLIAYTIDDRPYQGSAMNYDAFDVRMTSFFGEVISSRAFTTSEDFTLFEEQSLCAGR